MPEIVNAEKGKAKGKGKVKLEEGDEGIEEGEGEVEEVEEKSGKGNKKRMKSNLKEEVGVLGKRRKIDEELKLENGGQNQGERFVRVEFDVSNSFWSLKQD